MKLNAETSNRHNKHHTRSRSLSEYTQYILTLYKHRARRLACCYMLGPPPPPSSSIARERVTGACDVAVALKLQGALFRGRLDFHAQFLHSLEVAGKPGTQRVARVRRNDGGRRNGWVAATVRHGGRRGGGSGGWEREFPVVFLFSG